MYKRPTIRTHTYATKFVTEVRPNGAHASSWVRCEPQPAGWTGQDGRVGEIITAMHRGPGHVTRPSKPDWRPPLDYATVAKHMHESVREAYVARCEAWFEENKPHERPKRAPLEYDRELVQALFQKYPGRVPPFEERIKVYKVAGMPEAYVERAIARHEHLEATSAERQKVLDGVFGKWPSANKTVKVVPKVIKAVKKKIV
jgi:hypothetical protein